MTKESRHRRLAREQREQRHAREAADKVRKPPHLRPPPGAETRRKIKTQLLDLDDLDAAEQLQ